MPSNQLSDSNTTSDSGVPMIRRVIESHSITLDPSGSYDFVTNSRIIRCPLSQASKNLSASDMDQLTRSIKENYSKVKSGDVIPTSQSRSITNQPLRINNSTSRSVNLNKQPLPTSNNSTSRSVNNSMLRAGDSNPLTSNLRTISNNAKLVRSGIGLVQGKTKPLVVVKNNPDEIRMRMATPMSRKSQIKAVRSDSGNVNDIKLRMASVKTKPKKSKPIQQVNNQSLQQLPTQQAKLEQPFNESNINEVKRSVEGSPLKFEQQVDETYDDYIGYKLPDNYGEESSRGIDVSDTLPSYESLTQSSDESLGYKTLNVPNSKQINRDLTNYNSLNDSDKVKLDHAPTVRNLRGSQDDGVLMRSNPTIDPNRPKSIDHSLLRTMLGDNRTKKKLTLRGEDSLFKSSLGKKKKNLNVQVEGLFSPARFYDGKKHMRFEMSDHIITPEFNGNIEIELINYTNKRKIRVGMINTQDVLRSPIIESQKNRSLLSVLAKKVSKKTIITFQFIKNTITADVNGERAQSLPRDPNSDYIPYVQLGSKMNAKVTIIPENGIPTSIMLK